MGEVIQIHVGQAGVQIGNACWELYCLEHSIGPDGTLYECQCDNTFRSFFADKETGRVVPRTVLVDSEPTVIDQIRTGPFSDLYGFKSLITGKEDSGSNFARGYNIIGKELIDVTMEAIRTVAESCDNLSGFMTFRSLGGGTGSGLGNLILEQLSEQFGKTTKLEYIILPAPTMSPLIVEPYNALLSTHLGMDSVDCSFIIDNEALYDICSAKLNIVAPRYKNLNRIIGQTLSTFTASYRFPGSSNVTFSEFQTNLVPYPRIHYPIVSYAPFFPASGTGYINFSTEQVTNACFDPSNQLVRCNPAHGMYMACVLLYRGGILTSAINSSISELRENSAIRFVDWSPTGFKVGYNPEPPFTVPGGGLGNSSISVVALSNNTIIHKTWCELLTKYDRLFSRKAFVHQFVAEGLEEDTLREAADDICALVSDYKEAGSGSAGMNSSGNKNRMQSYPYRKSAKLQSAPSSSSIKTEPSLSEIQNFPSHSNSMFRPQIKMSQLGQTVSQDQISQRARHDASQSNSHVSIRKPSAKKDKEEDLEDLKDDLLLPSLTPLQSLNFIFNEKCKFCKHSLTSCTCSTKESAYSEENDSVVVGPRLYVQSEISLAHSIRSTPHEPTEKDEIKTCSMKKLTSAIKLSPLTKNFKETLQPEHLTALQILNYFFSDNCRLDLKTTCKCKTEVIKTCVDSEGKDTHESIAKDKNKECCMVNATPEQSANQGFDATSESSSQHASRRHLPQHAPTKPDEAVQESQKLGETNSAHSNRSKRHEPTEKDEIKECCTANAPPEHSVNQEFEASSISSSQHASRRRLTQHVPSKPDEAVHEKQKLEEIDSAHSEWSKTHGPTKKTKIKIGRKPNGQSGNKGFDGTSESSSQRANRRLFPQHLPTKSDAAVHESQKLDEIISAHSIRSMHHEPTEKEGTCTANATPEQSVNQGFDANPESSSQHASRRHLTQHVPTKSDGAVHERQKFEELDSEHSEWSKPHEPTEKDEIKECCIANVTKPSQPRLGTRGEVLDENECVNNSTCQPQPADDEKLSRCCQVAAEDNNCSYPKPSSSGNPNKRICYQEVRNGPFTGTVTPCKDTKKSHCSAEAKKANTHKVTYVIDPPAPLPDTGPKCFCCQGTDSLMFDTGDDKTVVVCHRPYVKCNRHRGPHCNVMPTQCPQPYRIYRCQEEETPCPNVNHTRDRA